MKEYDKQCVICGNAFVARTPVAKYCSDCREKAYKEKNKLATYKWRAEHHEEFLAWERRYQAKNSEKRRDYQRQYRKLAKDLGMSY